MSDSSQTNQPVKSYPTLGCCGLDCGLCPRYHTVGGSKCPGCCGQDFFNKHPSCSLITCCVKQKGLEVCAQCDEFPCSKFKRLTGDGGKAGDSFLTYKKLVPNLEYVREQGIEKFIEQQKKRIAVLDTMLRDFDDGRSKSYYCIAATLLTVSDLEESLNRAEQEIKTNRVALDDTKARAKILRGFLEGCADKDGIELKLRKEGKGDERN